MEHCDDCNYFGFVTQVKGTFKGCCVACRTGVIFCVSQTNRGENEASTKRSSPSRATRALRSPARFASVRLKYAKNSGTPFLRANVMQRYLIQRGPQHEIQKNNKFP